MFRVKKVCSAEGSPRAQLNKLNKQDSAGAPATDAPDDDMMTVTDAAPTADAAHDSDRTRHDCAADGLGQLGRT